MFLNEEEGNKSSGSSHGTKNAQASASDQDLAPKDRNFDPTSVLPHLLRLTGASIESTIWISWRHLEQFQNYGSALEKSNGLPGRIFEISFSDLVKVLIPQEIILLK